MFQDNTMIPSSRVKSYRHFGRRWEENYAPLSYYAASSGNSIQMYQNQSVPSSRVKKSLEKGRTGCPKMLVRNYHYLLHNSPVVCSSHLLHGRSLKSHMLEKFSASISGWQWRWELWVTSVHTHNTTKSYKPDHIPNLTPQWKYQISNTKNAYNLHIWWKTCNIQGKQRKQYKTNYKLEHKH